MSWVWEHSRAKRGARLVLLAIADVASDAGEATNYARSYKTLEAKTLLDEETIRRAIKTLVELGELEVIKTGDGRQPTDYRVPMTRHPQNEDPQNADLGSSDNPPQGPRHGDPHQSVLYPSGSIAAPAAPTQNGSKRDEVWDAVMAVCGISPDEQAKATKGERGKWNKAVAALKEADATPAEISRRARLYRLAHTTPLTPRALECNWSAVAAKAPAPSRYDALPEHVETFAGPRDDQAGLAAARAARAVLTRSEIP